MKTLGNAKMASLKDKLISKEVEEIKKLEGEDEVKEVSEKVNIKKNKK